MNAITKLSLHRWMTLLAGGLVLSAFALTVLGSAVIDLSTFLLSHQDRWLLLVETLMLFVIGERLGSRTKPLSMSTGLLVVASLLLVLFCYFGHIWILSSYDLSRDEQMAVFDSQIFAAGRRVQPLPAFWQQHLGALNTLYMPPVERPVAWVSAYLPGNAFLRALVGRVVDPAFTGPLLTAGGLVALYKCARLLWPKEREAAIIACLLYLTSGQIIFAGMTAFAMPAHLTFNLVWLWLFLLRRWQADLAALLIGFIATGLHQLLFHPLFAAPFLVLLLAERAWLRLCLYGMGYALISLFWLCWPSWTHALVAGPHSIIASTGADYWSQLKLMLAATIDARWIDMAANLLRFAAWQNLLLIPLMIAGAVGAWRDRIAAALLASLLILIVLMALIIPFQGNGFGYRYLHGTMGSAILLAVYGWRRLRAEQAILRVLLLRSTVVGFVIVMPLQAWMAHDSYSAFAKVERRVAASGVDYFAVGGEDTSFSGDLVINRSDLTNRPVRLFADALQLPFIAQLCASRPRIGLPTTRLLHPINAYFGAPSDPRADRRLVTLAPTLTAAGCTVVPVDGPPD